MLAWLAACRKGRGSINEWARKCQGPEAGACSTNQRGRKEVPSFCSTTPLFTDVQSQPPYSGEKQLPTEVIRLPSV